MEVDCQDFICYAYSLFCVNISKEPTPRYRKYATFIQYIKDIINLDLFVTIGHTLHEGNRCIDFLTNLGDSSTSKILIYISSESNLSDLLFVDST